jgi:chloramphenicol-sensitive protein RarD
MKKGIIHGIGAYLCWGLFPIFWKQLHDVDALQVIAHRIVWSFFTLLISIALLSRITAFRKSAFSTRLILTYVAAAVLIGINWMIYVWGVNSGHIVETSLGYFINPLFSVLFGVVFFKERLRLWQWIPIGIATCGVLFLSFSVGTFPWIAISLAISFSLYGLVKKIAPLNPLFGMTLETGLLLIPALIFLFYLESGNEGAFLHSGIKTSFLLFLAGIITTVPLLLFASAAQKIPLSLIGVLQYMAPSLQLICGVFIYHESFSSNQFIGYGIIWFALIIFATDGFLNFKQVSKVLEVPVLKP